MLWYLLQDLLQIYYRFTTNWLQVYDSKYGHLLHIKLANTTFTDNF